MTVRLLDLRRHRRRRVTGIGGVFFKARDRARLGEWYRRHLDIDVQEGGWAVFNWRHDDDPARPGETVWSLTPSLPRCVAKA